MEYSAWFHFIRLVLQPVSERKLFLAKDPDNFHCAPNVSWLKNKAGNYLGQIVEQVAS